MLKVYAIIAALAISFFSGFTVSNWHHDSLDLAATNAAQKVADKFQTDQKAVADNVVTSLDKWKQTNVQHNETIIREKLQPVFYAKCVTDDYVRMFNQQTNTFSTSGSSKPTAKAGN